MPVSADGVRCGGALLIPHTTPGVWRQTMFYGCFAMFGLSLVAALIIISMIWSRLVLFGTSGTARVPTLWIVLGPLGQSITAAGLLGANAALAVKPDLADNINAFSIIYGVPVWSSRCCGSRWPPRSQSGLCGGDALRADLVEPDLPSGHVCHRYHSAGCSPDLPAFRVAAVAAYLGLLSTWLIVAVRTARGSVRGQLLRPPPSGGPIRARKDPASS